MEADVLPTKQLAKKFSKSVRDVCDVNVRSKHCAEKCTSSVVVLRRFQMGKKVLCRNLVGNVQMEPSLHKCLRTENTF